MADKKAEDRNVNVYLKNEESHEDDVVLSFSTIIRKLRKYFLVWFLVAVIVGGLLVGGSIFFTTTSVTPVTAMISFNYDGIEQGKNPDGSDFDMNSLKNPTVLEAALTECGMDVDKLESVRQGLDIEAIMPQDAYERMTAYAKVFNEATSGQMSAAQQILDETWYSTQYKITLNFRETGLSRSDAVQLTNSILDNYKYYFYKTFGYNESLGNVLTSMDYNDYDYAEAIDMFDTTLTTMRRYVVSLSADDTTRFRSTDTGYTFADLLNTIDTIRSLDLDLLSSYITVNNVTKDKERVQAYYEYRIENLTRNQTEYEEKLASLVESIEQYEKDQIFIFSGEGTDANMSSTVASAQYDTMIADKITTQSDLSHTKQQIKYYNQRLTALKKTTVGSTDKVEQVESDLAKLDTKIKNLAEVVEKTANDYYENVSLSNAYRVLLPATSDAITSVKSGFSNIKLPVIGLECMLLMFYLVLAFSQALIEDNRKKKVKAALEAGKEASKESAAEKEDTDEKPEGEK